MLRQHLGRILAAFGQHRAGFGQDLGSTGQYINPAFRQDFILSCVTSGSINVFILRK